MMSRRAFLQTAALAPLLRVATPAAQPVKWQAGPSLPLARSEFQAARLGGEIIVAGGFDAGGGVDALDSAAGAWRRRPDVPHPVHHAGVAALDGRLYVIGGYSLGDGSAQARVQVYDPNSDDWGEAADLATAKGAFGCVTAAGRVWAIGGAAEHLSGPAVAEVERYDPALDRWETATLLPTPREHLAAAALDGVIYTMGGRANGDESTTFAAAVEAFDLATSAWRTLPRLPTPRAGLGGASVAGLIVAAGGERGELVFDQVEAYDPAFDQWRRLPSLPAARHGLALTADASERLFALGGSTLGGRVRSVTEVDILELKAAR